MEMRWGEMRLSIRFTLLATLLLLTSSTYRLQATGYRLQASVSIRMDWGMGVCFNS
jgi:hypothetical protein